MEWEGVKIYSRDCRHVGVATGATKRCGLKRCGAMKGCDSDRILVKWEKENPPGAVGLNKTWPCAGGLEKYKDGWKII